MEYLLLGFVKPLTSGMIGWRRGVSFKLRNNRVLALDFIVTCQCKVVMGSDSHH